MPTADVLATFKGDTLTHQYKLSLIKLFYKGCYGMLPAHVVAEQLIIQGSRSLSITEHGLIAPTFASNYNKKLHCLQRDCCSRFCEFHSFICYFARNPKGLLSCTNKGCICMYVCKLFCWCKVFVH